MFKRFSINNIKIWIIIPLYFCFSRKKRKLNIEEDFKLLFNKALKNKSTCITSVVFNPFVYGKGMLNACYLPGGIICLNKDWFIALSLNNNKIIEAFEMTIGHEEGHSVEQFSCKKDKKGKKDKQFISWVNEVHSDFWAVKKYGDGDINKFCDAVRVKENYSHIISLNKKEKYKYKDKPGSSHPSWKQRKKYISQIKYNEKIIDLIANDLELNDETLINKAKEHIKRSVLYDAN